MLVWHFIAIDPVVVEIFQSGRKKWLKEIWCNTETMKPNNQTLEMGTDSSKGQSAAVRLETIRIKGWEQQWVLICPEENKHSLQFDGNIIFVFVLHPSHILGDDSAAAWKMCLSYLNTLRVYARNLSIMITSIYFGKCFGNSLIVSLVCEGSLCWSSQRGGRAFI